MHEYEYIVLIRDLSAASCPNASICSRCLGWLLSPATSDLRLSCFCDGVLRGRARRRSSCSIPYIPVLVLVHTVFVYYVYRYKVRVSRLFTCWTGAKFMCANAILDLTRVTWDSRHRAYESHFNHSAVNKSLSS